VTLQLTYLYLSNAYVCACYVQFFFFSLLCDNFVRPEESIFSEKFIVQNKVRVDNLRHIIIKWKIAVPTLLK